MKYGVPESQWDEMAKRNDYDQVNLWGTTRARLMEAELSARIPARSETVVVERKRSDSQMALV